MDILEELSNVLKNAGIPIETGIFSDTSPDQYLVLTPIDEYGALYADNREEILCQEVRISLFSKCNYLQMKKKIIRLLKEADFNLTDRRYIGREDDTAYHHFAIDVSKTYKTKEE